jgi:endonuclease/exonuclease/phosphatase family metal-dependent hydrolase
MIPDMGLRLATFNLENLYSRFDFVGRVARARRLVGGYAIEDRRDYELARMAFEAVAADDMRQMTALAIAATRADIVCVQEVDNAEALDVFYEGYLKPVLRQAFAIATRGMDLAARDAISARFFYDFRHVGEGNDSRGIDVGVMARAPFEVTSNAALTYDFLGDAPLDWAALAAQGLARTQRVFKRDCLMVETTHDGAPLTLFVCHFKSMQPATAGGDGRVDTQAVRAAEVWAVRRLIEQRFGADVARANWAICGDFNDFLVVEGAPARHSALAPLFADGFSVNVVERLAPEARWTHYYTGGDAYVQLDYICLSPALAAANPDALPEIERRGQPMRVPRLADAPRFPRIGWDRPKASDHCPVTLELTLPPA